MTPEIKLRQVEEVPSDSRVCHYDELEPPAKERLSGLIERDAPAVGEEIVAGFNSCEFVKFTDYYRISISDPDSIR